MRRREWLARAALWSAAGLTIASLAAIVGYILYRGIVSDVVRESPVLPAARTAVELLPGTQPVSFIVHRAVRAAELTLPDIVRLVDGTFRTWEPSQQDLKVRLVFPPARSPLGELLQRRLPGAGSAWQRAAVAIDDARLIETVAATPGAIGVVAAEAARNARGVRIVPVRTLSLVVNPAVTAVAASRQLQFLAASDIAGLFSGTVGNWRTAGGADLRVRSVGFPPGSPEEEAFLRESGIREGTAHRPDIRVSSVEELARVLASTPGAVGYCSWLDLPGVAPALVLPVQRREVGWNLRPSFILEPPARAGRSGGISTIILNTVLLIVLTLLLATPLGVLAALYLVEYARQGRIVAVLRFATETLAGIPSIIFGLFGYIVFVGVLRLGIGLLSGTLTITIMILPTIIRTAEEAFLAVPLAYREGSMALGATKWQTMTRVVLPAASPGILTGVILAIGRTVGETAAMLLTLGTSSRLADSLSSSARVLSVHLYILVKEGISFERAFATGTILVLVILLVNWAATRLIRRLYGT